MRLGRTAGHAAAILIVVLALLLAAVAVSQLSDNTPPPSARSHSKRSPSPPMAYILGMRKRLSTSVSTVVPAAILPRKRPNRRRVPGPASLPNHIVTESNPP